MTHRRICWWVIQSWPRVRNNKKQADTVLYVCGLGLKVSVVWCVWNLIWNLEYEIIKELKNVLYKNHNISPNPFSPFNFSGLWVFSSYENNICGRYSGTDQQRKSVGWSRRHKKLTWTLEDNAGKYADPDHHEKGLDKFFLPRTKGKTHNRSGFTFLVCGIFKYYIKKKTAGITPGTTKLLCHRTLMNSLNCFMLLTSNHCCSK